MHLLHQLILFTALVFLKCKILLKKRLLGCMWHTPKYRRHLYSLDEQQCHYRLLLPSTQ